MIISIGQKETKNFAKNFAKSVFDSVYDTHHTVLVISLEGDLGTGKTTFAQGFAEGLGIKEKIQSPTFVILKIYKIGVKAKESWSRKQLIHVDAYRLHFKDFKVFGWEDFVKNPENIILVEWGNKIKKILPKDTIRILFKHNTKTSRKIVIVNNAPKK